jgi:hypothetical protein
MTILFRKLNFTYKQNCHPDRSVAQWRDLLFIYSEVSAAHFVPTTNERDMGHPSLC